MSETMRFFGTFGGEYKPNSNPILAFTIGDLTDKGWISDKANDSVDLIGAVKRDIKNSKKLILAVQTYGGFFNNFNLNDANLKQHHLDIKIFVLEKKAFRGTLRFFDVKWKGEQPSTTFDSPHKFMIFDLEVSNTVTPF